MNKPGLFIVLRSEDAVYGDPAGRLDTAAGTIKAMKKVGCETINLGGNSPYDINEMIGLIEEFLGKKARIERHAFHKTDMKATWADISKAKTLLNWRPKTTLREDLKLTVAWYQANKPWLSAVKL